MLRKKGMLTAAGRVLLCGAALAVASGCWRPAGIGVGGKYNDAVTELGKTRRGGEVNKAIVNLEYVARKDPTYRDGLTQLGRAYYYARRYQAAFDVLKRALALNDKDEIGWFVMGLTQFRQGDDEKALQSVRGGLTLLAKSMRDGYKDFTLEFWDVRGVVRRTLRRNITLARKGVTEKERLLVAGEELLHRIDRGLYDAEQDRSDSEYLDTRRDKDRK